MCECVNIQYKRLEQLSGASPQTQPGFGFQLAAGSFRGTKQHWLGGGSPSLHASLTSRAMLGGRPIRHHCLGPLQLAAFISAQVQHEGMLVTDLWLWVRECKEPKASTLVFFHQAPHTGYTHCHCLCPILFLQLKNFVSKYMFRRVSSSQAFREIII